MGDVSPGRRRLLRLRLTARRALFPLALLAIVACSEDEKPDTATAVVGGTSTPASATPPHARSPRVPPVTRLPSLIDENRWTTLSGNVPIAANSNNDVGPVDGDLVLTQLDLVLKRTPEVEAGLATFMEDQLDPTSPSFHQWLTPTELGDLYGPTDADIATLRAWLLSKGFAVDSVFPNKLSIRFSGTAARVQAAFHTTLRSLDVRGERHFANMTEPQIPAPLASIVSGVAGLHDFQPHSMRHDLGAVRYHRGSWSFTDPKPDFTVTSGGTYYAVTPPDFATIYNMNSVFAAGYRGANQTIGLIEQTSIKAADVNSFRSAFGLSGYAGSFSQVHTHTTGAPACGNPSATADEGEAALDAEWAGATAPDATILMWACSGGVLNALQNAVAAGSPKIISMSYGLCEPSLGASTTTQVSNIYQTGAAAGMSIFISSGDQASATCDTGAGAPTQGLAVSGLASSPYNVAVGGTDFMDLYDNVSTSGALQISKYWNATNTATHGSALSYIPEIPWNGSCASQLLYSVEGFGQSYGPTGFCNSDAGSGFVDDTGGGGGKSIYITQPSFQTGVQGLPTQSGGARYVPDVSLFAANGLWGHFYIYCMSDAAQGGVPCTYGAGNSANIVNFMAAGGTSFAAPAMAGIQALVNQKLGTSVGNPNIMYYKLAAAEYGLTGNALCDSDRGPTSAPLGPVADIERPSGWYGPTPDGIIPPTVGCVFYDVTKGDIDAPCAGGTPNCFGGVDGGAYGALSSSSASFATAYPATSGWDYATGLGTINVSHLVNGW